MTKAGQNTQIGIYVQNWAAMSLFLQFLRDHRFSYIHLESSKSEDFDLVFAEDKKIVCESKYKGVNLDYAQLKEILENIEKKKSIGVQDEILIVCKKLSTDLESKVKNIKYFEDIKSFFKRKGYSDECIELLSKVKFWKLSEKIDEELNYSLVADAIKFWLPEEDVKEFTDSIFKNNIFKKSTTGSTYSRVDFNQDVIALRTRVEERSDYFNNQNKKKKQFFLLEKNINGHKGIKWGTGSLSAFSARWDLMSFAMDRLKNRQDLDLRKWSSLWKLNKVHPFSFGIFNVFENNLTTIKNKEYALSYIKSHSRTIRGYYSSSDFFSTSVIKILKKIIENKDGENYLNIAFNITQDLISYNKDEFFYLKSNNDSHLEWEKAEVCKLIGQIFKQGDFELKQKIFKLLTSSFNITRDDGQFNHYAPKEVYDILKEWLNEDFPHRFPVLLKVIIGQFDRYYKKIGKKLEFKGWEHMGGGTAFWGSNYHIEDRHFIGFILAPCILQYYNKDKTKGWKFIKSYCINQTSKVSKNRPDFLNRSVYEIVFQRYSSEDLKISGEAFKILREFVMSRKGIPHKSDLIYQATMGSTISDSKKWNLIRLTTEKYNVPVNPFVEKVVSELAKKGHEKAREELKKWFKNPKYYNRFMSDMDTTSTIRNFLENDIDFAIYLFKLVITSEYRESEKSDHFSAFELARLLHDILLKDFSQGLDIFRLLESKKVLSPDQQAIYTHGLLNINENTKDSEETTMQIYENIVNPALNELDNNIEKIYIRFPIGGHRSAILQFADRLAKYKKIKEALRVVEIFMEDPDPYMPGQDPQEKNNEHNEHKRIEGGKEPHSITSVRGWCGWVLMNCSVLEGREFLGKIINLTERLVQDKNYYAIHMGSYALAQLASVRLTVLPSDRDTLFLNNDKKKALQISKDIENIAFDLLDRLILWPLNVQKAMTKSVLHVFDRIRSLNETEALRLVNALTKLPIDVTEESAALFLYYAEFRKNTYKKWRFSAPGLYDDLGPEKYDQRKFKAILIKTIKKLQKENPDSCFRFASMAEHTMREVSPEDNIDKCINLTIEYFDLLSDVYAHNIFNLIYQTIEHKFRSVDKHSSKWFNLLVKCLKIEKKFYEKELKKGNRSEVYWYPSLYHTNIMELLYEKVGKDNFMQAAKIFFSFPKGIELHESDHLVSTIKELSKTNKDAKKIINILRERNPSKYWEL
ncbi:MAG: hypothetical protein KBD55_00750 [Candidatus Pacebacteria bacterium]|nr:hypothetical protein [Candidatus Paceibacterota bacterium]